MNLLSFNRYLYWTPKKLRSSGLQILQSGPFYQIKELILISNMAQSHRNNITLPELVIWVDEQDIYRPSALFDGLLYLCRDKFLSSGILIFQEHSNLMQCEYCHVHESSEMNQMKYYFDYTISHMLIEFLLFANL